MAAKIINLRQARKQKSREAAKARSAENSVKFGRNARQKHADASETTRREAHLDRSRLEMPPEDAS
ncbi:MAG: DUF4169 family protein [Rhodobacteraceae bacterium]|nr:MAG: DUF4169 family protein [Paracoccaceae bacterium]